MSIKIISWNVRGENEKGKREAIRAMMRQWRSSLICLQETKISNMEEAIIRSLWGIRKVGWEAAPADDTRGGIVVIWNTGLLELKDKWVGKHTVSIMLMDKTNDRSWWFTGIYCPCDEKGRLECWTEMGEATSRRGSCPWIVGGDFNAVADKIDRSGNFKFTEADKKLIDFINNEGLMNLNLEGGEYTWSNLRENPVFSRIDRFLCTPDWTQIHKSISQKRMERITSDHWPISLELADI